MSSMMYVAFSLRVILLPALEEQLAASCHEAEVTHLRETLVVKNREWVVVARIWQGVSVALATMQLHIGQDLPRVEPRLSDYAG